MSLLKIIGLGSPLGDDRLGWLAAEQLRQELSAEEASIEISDRPGVGLLSLMAGAELVIIIDALLADLPIGSLLSFHNEEIQTAPTPLSSHAFGVAEALNLGRSLACLPRQIALFGMVVDPGNQTESLSLPVQQQLPGLIQLILAYIQSIPKCEFLPAGH